MHKIIKTLILSLFLLSILACGSDSQRVIVLQPLGNFPTIEAQVVLQKIKEIEPNIILRKNIPFPETAFYEPRKRYRADTLLSYLVRKVGGDSVIVGLSEKDISTTKDEIKDWGVMGLGYQPGNACVISSFRVSPKNRREQFYKVVLHEIGHTQGLEHCQVKSCLMRDAEGGNPLDQEKEFCSSCKQKLKKKNWKIQ
jgi:archaemetzincin